MRRTAPARTGDEPPRPKKVDGALLRLTVDGDDWAEHVPPVPPGFEVTVCFSNMRAAVGHADALGVLGYRVVDTQEAPGQFADILVRQRLLEAHPSWWRALAGLADRAYSLACGPVLASIGPALVPHLRPAPPAADR